MFNGFDRTLEKLGEILQLMYRTKHHNIIAGNLREGGGKIFVIESLSTNILPTNEATLPTFTCSASSNHDINNLPNQKCFDPRR